MEPHGEAQATPHSAARGTIETVRDPVVAIRVQLRTCCAWRGQRQQDIRGNGTQQWFGSTAVQCL